MAKSKKQTKTESSNEWKPVKVIPDTPQSLAEGFTNLAKFLTKTINQYVYRQQEPEFEGLCELYRVQAKVLWEHAKRIGITLPAIHTLSGDTDHKVLKSMRTWCESAAEIAADAAAQKKRTTQEPTTFLTGDTTITDELIRERLDNDIAKILSTKTLQEIVKLIGGILPFWCDNCLGHTPYGEALILIIRGQAVELREKHDGDVLVVPGPEADLLSIQDWATSTERALRDHILWSDETTKRVVWDDDNPDYISLKDAADKSGGRFTAKALGKHLRRKNNTTQWMNYKQRTKVNRPDFDSYLKRDKEIAQTRERASNQSARIEANRQQGIRDYDPHDPLWQSEKLYDRE